MSNRRITFLLVVLLLAAILVPSCSGGNATEDSTSAEEITTGEIQIPAFILNEGKSCKVVYSAECTPDEHTAAVKIRNKIEDLTDKDCDMGDDFIAAWAEHDSSSVEILVGMTSYNESKTVQASLKGLGDWCVRLEGKKVVVAGKSAKALEKASTALCKALAFEDGKLSVPAALDLSGSVNTAYDSFPTPDILSVRTFEGDDFSELFYSDTKDADFDAYCKKLEDAGYKKYFTNNVLGTANRYAQYTDAGDKESITVFRAANDASMRVINEKLSASDLPPVAKNGVQKVCDPLFFMIGCTPENDPTGNGMSLLFRLSDGSFIIWDGGFDDSTKDAKTYNRQNAARLLDIMKKNAPDPDHIRIAAWFITHPHIDHGGAMQYFVKNYATNDGRVSIERLITWLPSSKLCEAYTDNLTYVKISEYAAVLKTAKNKGAQLHRAHPGQLYRIGDAEIEVLYTDDMRLPVAGSDSNATSVVCRISLGGSSFLITGDTTSASGGASCHAMYGEAMKSDFLQLPHHAMNKMPIDFYKDVDPDVLLRPASTACLNETNLIPVQTAIGAEKVKNSLVTALFDTYCFKLPYNGVIPEKSANEAIK